MCVKMCAETTTISECVNVGWESGDTRTARGARSGRHGGGPEDFSVTEPQRTHQRSYRHPVRPRFQLVGEQVGYVAEPRHAIRSAVTARQISLDDVLSAV